MYSVYSIISTLSYSKKEKELSPNLGLFLLFFAKFTRCIMKGVVDYDYTERGDFISTWIYDRYYWNILWSGLFN